MQSFYFDYAFLPDGFTANVGIDVEDGQISAIKSNAESKNRIYGGYAVLPGLSNVHSHTFQRAMAGLTERRSTAADSFWSWRDVMYRFMNVLDADDFEAIATFAFMEMLEKGYTSVGEFHYLHHDQQAKPYRNRAEHCERLAAACTLTGIGLTFLPVFYESSGFGDRPFHPTQARFIHTIDDFSKFLDQCRHIMGHLTGSVIGLAPHSLRAVSAKSLTALLTLHRPGDPIHIHVAEQLQEVKDCIAWSGQRPVEWLLDHMPVDQDWTLIHATHISRTEVEGIISRKANIGLCPITEANLGDGIFPAVDFLKHRGSFGIGSDSNIEIDAFAELKMLEYSQRQQWMARNLLALQSEKSTGETMYYSALAGGARALGRKSAQLQAGGAADFITLDRTHSQMACLPPRYWIDSVIFNGAHPIDKVYVRGVEVVSNGRHRAKEAITSAYIARMKKIMNQL